MSVRGTRHAVLREFQNPLDRSSCAQSKILFLLRGALSLRVLARPLIYLLYWCHPARPPSRSSVTTVFSNAKAALSCPSLVPTTPRSRNTNRRAHITWEAVRVMPASDPRSTWTTKRLRIWRRWSTLAPNQSRFVARGPREGVPGSAICGGELGDSASSSDCQSDSEPEACSTDRPVR